MRISAEDYPALKAFFVWVREHLAPPPPPELPPEHYPVAVMNDFERRSMAMARKGLALAIGDTLEEFSLLTRQQVATIDDALRADGVITLTEVRARFWSKIGRIRKRGNVRNDEEYYALRNIVEALPEAEQHEVWGLMAAYEAKALAT